MSQITTHVLDISCGRPAAGIPVLLEAQQSGGEWKQLADAVTDGDGRVLDLNLRESLGPGIYRLSFNTRAYFSTQEIESLYPHVTITFEVKDVAQHYHIPLLLSPFGYSTYRGS